MCWCAILDNIKTIIDIVIGVIGIIVAVIGVSLFHSYRRKQMEASFGYLARLKVRIAGLRGEMKDSRIQKYLLDDLTIPKLQNMDVHFINEKKVVLRSIYEEISELLCFLKETDDQLPPMLGWSNVYSKLLDNLGIINLYSNPELYFWSEEPNIKYSKEEFMNEFLDTLDAVTVMITAYQKYVEVKIAKNNNEIEKKIQKYPKK